MGILARFLRRQSSSSAQQERGLQGERAAARYLRQKGFKILVQRYRSKLGEIDLVARENETLVFIEVKTRASAQHGEPSEAVTVEKQKHISRVALEYLRKLNHPRIPVRFDIIEVISLDGHMKCHHIPDAFPLAEPYIY